MVEERASQNVEKALVQNVEFGRALSAFSQLPPEERQEGLLQLGEFGNKMLETLKLEAKMFLGLMASQLRVPLTDPSISS
jgi:hypothetical protein